MLERLIRQTGFGYLENKKEQAWSQREFSRESEAYSRRFWESCWAGHRGPRALALTRVTGRRLLGPGPRLSSDAFKCLWSVTRIQQLERVSWGKSLGMSVATVSLGTRFGWLFLPSDYLCPPPPQPEQNKQQPGQVFWSARGPSWGQALQLGPMRSDLATLRTLWEETVT